MLPLPSDKKIILIVNMFFPAVLAPCRISNIIHGPKSTWHEVFRYMAKGSPGQSQGKPRQGRGWRLKVTAGTQVTERQVVVTQRDMNYHPGLNVSGSF